MFALRGHIKGPWKLVHPLSRLYYNSYPINWRISVGIWPDLSLSNFYGTYAKNSRCDRDKILL